MSNKNHRVRIKNDITDMKIIWRDPMLLTTIIFVILILATFIIFPLFSVLKESFIGKDGLTLQSYMATFKKINFRNTFRNTIVLGFAVGGMSTLIGFIFAYADSYIKSHFKKLFNVVWNHRYICYS